MNPWKASARFAAFVWYLNRATEKPAEEASRFARDNWIAFLPYANEGIGKLLVAMSEQPVKGRKRPETAGSASPATGLGGSAAVA
jgi:hypothetical protein